MYNMDLTLRTDSLPTFPSKKEARTAVLSLSQGARDYTARKVDGVWAVLPSGYVEAVEEAGDVLPDTLAGLEEDVRTWVAVEVEAVEEVAQVEEAQVEVEAMDTPLGSSPEAVEALGALVEATEAGNPEAVEEARVALVEALEEEVSTEEAPQVEEAPEAREARIREVRTQLEALRAQVRALEGVLAGYQSHILVTSTVARPVALLRDIFLAHVTPEGNPGPRKVVVALATKAGMAPNTAKTQYQVLSRALRTPTDPKHTGLWEDLEALRSNMEEDTGEE